MGIPPSEVRHTTLADFNAICQGWDRAHQPRTSNSTTIEMSDEALADMGIEGF